MKIKDLLHRVKEKLTLSFSFLFLFICFNCNQIFPEDDAPNPNPRADKFDLYALGYTTDKKGNKVVKKLNHGQMNYVFHKNMVIDNNALDSLNQAE